MNRRNLPPPIMGDEDLRLLADSNQNTSDNDQSLIPQPSAANAPAMEEGKSSNDPTLDPWVLYGGNIAAACRATNDSVTEQATKGEDNDTDAEKIRQRANSRLTAWQSRERKRIEFEVLQERKEELTERNLRLKKDNEHLKGLIERLKAGTFESNDAMNSLFDIDATSSPLFASHSGFSLPTNTANLQSGSALHPMHSSISSSAAAPHGAQASSFNPSSLVAANLARMQQHSGSQQDNLLFPNAFHHPQQGTSASRPAFFPGAMQRSNNSGNNSSVRRGGLADPPSRPPSLLLSPTQNHTRLPIQRYLGGNDIIAPTVFAPLQRGGQQNQLPPQQQQQQHQMNQDQFQYPNQQQQQQIQQNLHQGMQFASGLPFNLSSLMTPPPTDGDIDVPLFRAVHQQAKYKGESFEDAKLGPPNKKQRGPSSSAGGGGGGSEERKQHDFLLSSSPLESPGASVDS